MSDGTKIEYREQKSVKRTYVAGAKNVRTEKEGYMASRGRWSAHGEDRGTALANLKRMLGEPVSP